MRLAAALAAALLAHGAAACAAERYPSRPVRLIVPFPAGGGVDGAARVYAQPLTERLGVQVVIDNRGGSGGVIAAELAARALPDGYTLFFGGSASHGITPHLYRKLPDHPVADFTPVIHLGSAPYFLVVHPAVPAHTVKELVALARAKPGSLNYASAGSGSTLHLTAELFRSLAGISIVHVPYKGAGPALTDLLSGQVQMTFNPAVVVAQHVAGGRLRALGVSSAKRVAAFPDIPTVAEAGVPGFEATGWYALLAPGGLPAALVAHVNRDATAVLKEPELAQKLAPLGVEPTGGTPQQLAAWIAAELAKWGRVVRESGARVD